MPRQHCQRWHDCSIHFGEVPRHQRLLRRHCGVNNCQHARRFAVPRWQHVPHFSDWSVDSCGITACLVHWRRQHSRHRWWLPLPCWHLRDSRLHDLRIFGCAHWRDHLRRRLWAGCYCSQLRRCCWLLRRFREYWNRHAFDNGRPDDNLPHGPHDRFDEQLRRRTYHFCWMHGPCSRLCIYPER